MRRPSGVLRPAAATAWPITWPPNTCPPGCGEESPSKARTVVGEARDSSTVISRRSSSRSEERRVGKECRSQWVPNRYTKQNQALLRKTTDPRHDAKEPTHGGPDARHHSNYRAT